MRRFFTLLVLLLPALGVWFFWSRADHRNPAEDLPAASSSIPAQPVVAPAAAVPARARVADANSTVANSTEPRIALADGLNAPDGDIHRDLMILRDILIAWRTNYPHDGNPVGENADITAVLTGGNSLQLAFIPKNHPAINARGELCDRWGTPFVFHQLSGTQMEIRSAGPDRKLYTPDDTVLTP